MLNITFIVQFSYNYNFATYSVCRPIEHGCSDIVGLLFPNLEMVVNVHYLEARVYTVAVLLL